MGHGWQRVGVGAKGEQHVRAIATAAEPPCRVVLETHWGDRSELLALFDLVQTNSRADVEWRGQNGPIAESTRADLIPSANPAEDQAGGQHVCYLLIAHIEDVVPVDTQR